MSKDDDHRQKLAAAARHLRSAMELLDEAGAPDQIAARVDHAVCELDDFIASSEAESEQIVPKEAGVRAC